MIPRGRYKMGECPCRSTTKTAGLLVLPLLMSLLSLSSAHHSSSSANRSVVVLTRRRSLTDTPRTCTSSCVCNSVDSWDKVSGEKVGPAVSSSGNTTEASCLEARRREASCRNDLTCRGVSSSSFASLMMVDRNKETALQRPPFVVDAAADVAAAAEHDGDVATCGSLKRSWYIVVGRMEAPRSKEKLLTVHDVVVDSSRIDSSKRGTRRLSSVLGREKFILIRRPTTDHLDELNAWRSSHSTTYMCMASFGVMVMAQFPEHSFSWRRPHFSTAVFSWLVVKRMVQTYSSGV